MRLRKAKEAGKQAPNTRRNITSYKDKTQDKEGPKAVESKRTRETRLPGSRTKEHWTRKSK